MEVAIAVEMSGLLMIVGHEKGGVKRDKRTVRTTFVVQFLVSIVVSIPACHAGDRGSIPRRGGTKESFFFPLQGSCKHFKSYCERESTSRFIF